MGRWTVPAILALLLAACLADEGDLDSIIAGVFGGGADGPRSPSGGGDYQGDNGAAANVGGGGEYQGGNGGNGNIGGGDYQGGNGGNGNIGGGDYQGGNGAGGGGGSGSPSYQPGDNLPDDKCECVPYYLCENDTIITDGTGLIDIRFQGGACESYMDVCCKLPLEEAITPPPIQHKVCGYRNADGVGFRITGNYDNEAQFGEFPWMIAILVEEEVENENVLNVYQCGGSLIHPSVVLTAAHCVVSKDAKILKVRGGEWDTQTTNELYHHQDRKVTHVIVHEKYYAGALYNDIALLILDSPFDYAPNINIVCLPRHNDIIMHEHCLASGWGKDVYGKEGNYQVILKKVDLPVVPNDYCQDALRQTRLGPRFRLHDSFMCAGGVPGKDTCKGDGGSPLVCPVGNSDTQYQQVGIVAWGIGCGNSTPAVYVNVARFTNWIDDKLQRFDLHPGYHH